MAARLPHAAGHDWEPWEEVAAGSSKGRSFRHSSRGGGQLSTCEIQTGYAPSVLTELWSSAAPHFVRHRDKNSRSTWVHRTKQMWRSQHYFYVLLMYIHLYPPHNNMVDILVTSRVHVDFNCFYKMILPSAHSWSLVIDEIRWEARLDLDNHHPFFPYLHTVIWDSTCFMVEKPTDWTFGRLVVNGHYDWPCLLVLLGINFKGEIVFMSGMHRSTAYDANIFEDTRHLHPQFDWEMNLGDGHFATVRNFNTPAQKTGGRELNDTEKLWNRMLQLVRARVEHLNTVVKAHQMFKQSQNAAQA
mmetsp:Transcript_7073/g.12768  ORF Transcript_7073/g.12768 Transcript_7073/m.12768 type:complete len:301 (-) Transcript_7073:227-1129(-)